MNTQFRFAMVPTFHSVRHMADPDVPLPWQDIAQVLVPSTSDACVRQNESGGEPAQASTTCPICLSPPTAPRMTRCGHVYCYACIMHYLAVSENSKGTRGPARYTKRCPVCWDDIVARDLKAVHWIDAQNMADTHTAAFLAGRRAQGAPPLDEKDSPGILTLRLMERPQDSTVALPRSADGPINARGAAPCTLPDALAYARCVLASRDMICASLEADIASVEAEMASQNAAQLDELCLEFLRVARTHLQEEWEHAKALPDLMRSDDEHRASSGMTYFYYQAASGENVFVHPIDIKVLLSHFGAYSAFPDTLMVAVQHAEEGTVDEALRKKCKYLAHLPMSTDVMFVEIDWARTSAVLGPIQGDISWKSWSSTLAQRRQRHREKSAKEERARQRAEKEARSASQRANDAMVDISALDTRDMSFRESAMIGAEMHFPVHPGAAVGESEGGFPSMVPQAPAPARADQPRTVWGTPAAASSHTSATARDTQHMDAAWSALEASVQDDGLSGPTRNSKQRPKRKPKLILTGGGGGGAL